MGATSSRVRIPPSPPKTQIYYIFLMNKIIYLVRHGQSMDNISPVFQGIETKLSDKGREQAKKISKRLADYKFDAFISSSYPRAIETAEIIAQDLGLEFETNDLFVERVKPNSLNGKPHSDLEADKKWRRWEEGFYNTDIKIEEGENYIEIVKRADEALEYLKNREEEKILIVTHGFFLRTLVARVVLGDMLNPSSFKRMQKMMGNENASLTILKYKDAFEEDHAWRLWVHNDHSHLG